jgi:hypothetical protein
VKPLLTPTATEIIAECVTGLALNDEEHTITQSLVGLDWPQGRTGLLPDQV